MAGYIGTQPVPQAIQTRDSFTATAGQTSFATGGYTPHFLDVYLNGVHLQNGTDYTAGNGSDVVLTTGAAADDVLEVVAYSTFDSANTYNRTEADAEFVQVSGDTMTGDLNVTGTLAVDNISDGTDTVETGYVVNGSAKAWINFNGGGTVAVRDGLNMSSLIDNAAGDYTTNFTNAFSSASYFPSFSATVWNVGYSRNCGLSYSLDLTASSVRFINGYANPYGTGVAEDPDVAGVSAHGDLA